ncbi:fimbriae usher StfC domain protein [Escherichia coli 3-373-03_S3_C1]|nr:fimbriae usher StfC domain protein [Escherichia coli 3-373-03_S3_C1]
MAKGSIISKIFAVEVSNFLTFYPISHPDAGNAANLLI